jgi:hypothetical protein
MRSFERIGELPWGLQAIRAAELYQKWWDARRQRFEHSLSDAGRRWLAAKVEPRPRLRLVVDNTRPEDQP